MVSFLGRGIYFADVVNTVSERYADEIQTPAGLHALTAALLDRGVSEADLRKFLGENWMRVLAQTWRA